MQQRIRFIMTNMFVGMGSHPTVTTSVVWGRRKGYRIIYLFLIEIVIFGMHEHEILYTSQYDLFYMRTNSAENVLVWY